jgi:hypothetical protein
VPLNGAFFLVSNSVFISYFIQSRPHRQSKLAFLRGFTILLLVKPFTPISLQAVGYNQFRSGIVLFRIINCICLFFISVALQAQTIGDSTGVKIQQNKVDTAKQEVLVPKHSPKKACILSAVLPGAGQVYNQRNWWWKVPLIYGAGGALVYGAIFYQDGYNEFRNAYKERLEKGVNDNPEYNRYQTTTLQAIRDSYRQSRDMCYIGIAAVYALQIVDAGVEAHFFDFNINENVSLNIQPRFNIVGNNNINGLQFTLKF